MRCPGLCQTQTGIHTCMHPSIRPYIRPHKYIQVHTYMHTYIHTYIHTDRQTDRQTDRKQTRTCMSMVTLHYWLSKHGYMYTSMYVCMYVCMYVPAPSWRLQKTPAAFQTRETPESASLRLQAQNPPESPEAHFAQKHLCKLTQHQKQAFTVNLEPSLWCSWPAFPRCRADLSI